MTTYGSPALVGVHPEGGGFVATCVCSWLRWLPDQRAAARDYAAHVKGCKAHPSDDGD